MSNERVVLNISGTRFELGSGTFAKLLKLSNSACLAEASVSGEEFKEYFFERNAASFEALLEFLQHGGLHLPSTICPDVFTREMRFWGADVTEMGNCCFVKLVVFDENRKNLERFEKSSNQKLIVPVAGSTPMFPKWERFRATFWNVLDKPASSWLAKVYLVFLAVFVLASLFVLVAGTHPQFHRVMSRKEWKQYLGHKGTSKLLNALQDYFGDRHDDDDDYDYSTQSTDYASNDTYYSDQPSSSSRPPSRKPKDKLKANPYPEAAARVDGLRYLEYVTTAFFSLDFVLRNVFCPRKIRYFFSFNNVADLLALASVYAISLIEILKPKEKFRISSIDFIECFQFLRVLRLVRLLQDVHGVRVLFYSLRSSIPELCLLFCFLASGVFLFATVVFFVDGKEQMKSIPDAAWWALITMTTVGYGDMVPVTFQGKLIGSLCAISGVIVIGLTVPIFVSNFVMFYSYSKTFEARKIRKCPRKIIQTVEVHTNKIFPNEVN